MLAIPISPFARPRPSTIATTTEEVGIPGVVLEMCGVRRELGVLREVLLEAMSLGPGAGVVNELPGVSVLLEPE